MKSHKNTKHGWRYTRLYTIWRSIKGRCLVETFTGFKYYGGRGIKVCSEWIGFVPFMQWAMNNGYKDNLTIHRIDNDKGYDSSNCIWVSMKDNVQARWLNGCKQGHPWTKENTRVYKDGKRRCKICEKKQKREYYLEHRGGR